MPAPDADPARERRPFGDGAAEPRPERPPSRGSSPRTVRAADPDLTRAVPRMQRLPARVPGQGDPRRRRPRGDHRGEVRRVRRVRRRVLDPRASSRATTCRASASCSPATGPSWPCWPASSWPRCIPLEAEEIEAALEAVGLPRRREHGARRGDRRARVRAALRAVGVPARRCAPRARWSSSTCAGSSRRSWARSRPSCRPYVAQARLVKALYPGDVAVVYVSPVLRAQGRVRGSRVRRRGGRGDRLLRAQAAHRATPLPDWRTRLQGRARGARRPEPLKEISLTDGFPRSTLASHTHGLERRLRRPRRRADGPLPVRARAAARRRRPSSTCSTARGASTGPTVSPGLSVFAKRTLESAAREQQPRANVRTRELLRYLPSVELVRSFKRAGRSWRRCPTTRRSTRCCARASSPSRAEVIDCGACGYPTCVEHARGDLARRLDLADVLPAADAPDAQRPIDELSALGHDRPAHRPVEPARLHGAPGRGGRRGSTATRRRCRCS